MSKSSGVRRILVALDASPSSLAALEVAARMAARVGAEILGLYVEDESLLRGADLPLTRIVGSFSGKVRRVERQEIEQQLRAQAELARRAVEAAAVQSRVRWSFRVTRGSVTASLSAASLEADIISLGRGRTPRGGSVGRTTASLLESEGAPVLLLDRDLGHGQAVVAVYDGAPGSSAALGLASVLAAGESQAPFFVVLRGSEGQLAALEDSAANELKRLGVDRGVQFFRLGRDDPGLLARLNRQGGIGVLVLPRGGALGRSVAELMTGLRCPVLVVRARPDRTA